MSWILTNKFARFWSRLISIICSTVFKLVNRDRGCRQTNSWRNNLQIAPNVVSKFLIKGFQIDCSCVSGVVSSLGIKCYDSSHRIQWAANEQHPFDLADPGENSFQSLLTGSVDEGKESQANGFRVVSRHPGRRILSVREEEANKQTFTQICDLPRRF
jgi:hypothetical protein